MSAHEATTLVHARTPEGVVTVSAGERVPSDTLPAELERLVRFGAVREMEAGSPASIDPPADPVDPEPAGRGRRTGKGTQG